MDTSNYSKQFFSQADIEVLKWLACSPDLYPMENLWLVLVSKVYKHFR